MRVITVDNGNTNPHVGIFQNDILEKIIPLKDYSALPDDFIIISDVGAPTNLKASFDLKSRWAKNKFFDMPVHYTETLGDDRLIVAYGIYMQKKSKEKILVIDAGTFMTMDLIDDTGFVGGYIFPGINIFLASYRRGAHLPTLTMKENIELKDFPHTTEEAIFSAAEIYLNSVLETVIKKTSPDKIVITGGSSEFIKNKILKLNLSKAQFETNPHLIHSSLFWIYRHHLRSK